MLSIILISFVIGLLSGAILMYLFLDSERRDTRKLMDIVIDERQKLRKELYEIKTEFKSKFNKKDDE